MAAVDAGQRPSKKQLQESRWEATTVFEATKDGPDLRLNEVRQQLDAEWRQLQAIGQEAVGTLQRRRQWRDYPEPQAAGPREGARGEGRGTRDDPKLRFTELAAQAKRQLRGLLMQTISRLFEGAQPLGMLVFLWLIAIYPSGLVAGWAGSLVQGGPATLALGGTVFAALSLAGATWLGDEPMRAAAGRALALLRRSSKVSE